MYKKLKRNLAAERLMEEKLFEQVVIELSQGEKRLGLWGKAIANSDGLEEKAKSLYIQYRVQSIKDELEIAEAINEQENESFEVNSPLVINERPYSYEYPNISVKYDGEIYWVGSKSFSSTADVRSFINDGHL
jgi:hypothetical protein